MIKQLVDQPEEIAHLRKLANGKRGYHNLTIATFTLANISWVLAVVFGLSAIPRCIDYNFQDLIFIAFAFASLFFVALSFFFFLYREIRKNRYFYKFPREIVKIKVPGWGNCVFYTLFLFNHKKGKPNKNRVVKSEDAKLSPKKINYPGSVRGIEMRKELKDGNVFFVNFGCIFSFVGDSDFISFYKTFPSQDKYVEKMKQLFLETISYYFDIKYGNSTTSNNWNKNVVDQTVLHIEKVLTRKGLMANINISRHEKIKVKIDIETFYHETKIQKPRPSNR